MEGEHRTHLADKGRETIVTVTDTEQTPVGDEGVETSSTDSTDSANDSTDYRAEADKWKALSRKHEAQSKQNAKAAARLKELEDANKSDLEKAQAASQESDRRAQAAEAKAERYEVALEKNVPSNLMKFLTGETREEIEASADELLEALKPDTGGENQSGRPKERLRPGASTDEEPEESDPAKLAAKISRM